MNCPHCGNENPVSDRYCMACATALESPPESIVSSGTEIPTASDFVGRERELGELVNALQRTLSSQGELLMLVGEPGIGKTRTAQELSTVAASQGFQVLWGWCYEGGGAPPYWPWIQCLRNYIQAGIHEPLMSILGPQTASIAELLPEVREMLPDLETLPVLESAQAQFRLFDSITRFLQNAAQVQPLLLVLEDLHWADQSSLQLLEFVARGIESSRILVLGTYRDTEVSRRHPLSQTLGGLIRERRFLRVSLGGLSMSEVGEWIHRSTGSTAPYFLMERIHQRTDGNPLFMGEVVRLLKPGAPDSWEGTASDIPEGVRDALGRNLNHLSETCNRVMTTASVIGREFDFQILHRLNQELDEVELLEVVEEALDAHVIMPTSRPGETYEFRHALLQETLLSELSPGRRVRLHARIGVELEELYEDNVEAHASELVYHFSQAEPILWTDKLVRYSLLAGEQALASYAWEQALGDFELGLAAKEGQQMDAEMAALMYGLARAQAATLPRESMDKAAANLNCSLDYYVDAGDVPGALMVASFTMPLALGHLSGIAERISRALALVPSDSDATGRLLSNYGRLLGTEENDYDMAQESLSQSLTIARRTGDTPLEMRALANAARVNFYHCHYLESLEQSLKAIELARQFNDSGVEEDAHVLAAFDQCALGHLEEARQHGNSALVIAEGQRDRYWLVNVLWRNQSIAIVGGDWILARSIGDRALAVAPRHPPIFGYRVLLEYEQGNFDSGKPLLERFVELVHSTAPGPTSEYVSLSIVIAEVARITGSPDHMETAAGAAQAVLSSPNALPFYIVVARSSLALLAAINDDAAAATEQYAALEHLQSTLVPMNYTAVDRLLGLLSQTMGNPNQAATHFDNSLAFCRTAGYQPELAWTFHDYAKTLIQRNNLGDMEKANSMLDESLSISTELGMRPLKDRVVTLQKQTLSQPAHTSVHPDGLTQREVEVLCLVAKGRTDHDIAEFLVIAESTVRRHISNIYAKTAVNNRAEATRYALRAGIVSIDDATDQ